MIIQSGSSVTMRKKFLILARARTGLSFCSNRNPTSKAVSIEVRDSVGVSNIQWRGWSYAASVPSDMPNAQKGRKRISRYERRAMVESFVNKYRAMNAGKFPTITDTKKQVGGSYYVVREIFQELEYESKMNSSNSTDDNLVEKELLNESKPMTTESMKVSSGNTETANDRPIQDDSQSVVLVESSSSDSVSAAVSLSLKEDIEHVSAPLNETSGTSYGKALRHESEFVGMENRLIMEKKCVEKAGYERRGQASLKDLSEDLSQSSLQMPNDVKTEEAVSGYSSESVTPERHLLKEEIEHVSVRFIEKSGSSCIKAHNHDSEFVDAENPLVIEKKSFEKAGYEKREQDALEDLAGVDGQKHKMEQCQGSLELDESRIDNSNDRETSVTEVSKKSTLWENLKSFADGIINIWRKS